MNSTEQSCPLCQQEDVILRNDYAYVRRDNFQLSRGHVLVVPIRHVAGYFDMTLEEKHAVTPFGKFSGARRRCLVLNLIFHQHGASVRTMGRRRGALSAQSLNSVKLVNRRRTHE